MSDLECQPLLRYIYQLLLQPIFEVTRLDYYEI